MARRRSRIAYALVDGGLEYRAEALRNDAVRRGDLIATAAALADVAIDLLVFPAGYFQVRDADAQRRLRDHIASMVDEVPPSFGIVFGIDCWSNSAKRATKKSSSDGHPYYAMYRSRSGVWTTMRQVSVNTEEGTQEIVDARWRDRALLLPETDIAFLICGESWSNALLDRVADSGCRVLAIAAHRTVKMHREKTGYGKLSWHLRLDAFSRKHGVPIVLSEHTRSPDRHPYAWPRSISTPLDLDGIPAGVTLRLASV